MACGRCDGYYGCRCDELDLEIEIKNLRNQADSKELELQKLRERRKDWER
jgi:predicted  nucleic acid-binding Zn-ribbon protein